MLAESTWDRVCSCSYWGRIRSVLSMTASVAETRRRSRYRRYLLTVLAVVLAFNYVDRLALGLVLENIKTDFHLSDTQLGLLTGVAFALFYSTLGVPIGRWADRGNRITIITMSTGLWSLMVMLCGATRSFAQLVLMRIGVAVGEAGCVPPAYSLIGDYFVRAERPKAIANYLLGSSLSIVVGYFAAGWLNQLYGWRTMFAVIGGPGLVLAVVAWLTLQEPRLYRSAHTAVGVGPGPAMPEVFQTLWGNRTFRHVLFMIAVISFFGYGVGQWQPTFFVRSYGLNTGELGTWFTIIYGVGGFIGTYCGGYLASRYAPGNEALQIKILAILYVTFGINWIFVYLTHSDHMAFGLMCIGAIGGSLGSGPLFAVIQNVVPERMRAVSITVVYLFSNLIGMGLGPLAVGSLSDALRPEFGGESLRYALLAMCPAYLWGSWHLWKAAGAAPRDIEAASQEDVRRGGCYAEASFP